MAINGIAKVQHYVPRFLLKNFVTGKTAAILKPIIREESLESLTPEDRYALSYCLAIQFVRTKQWRENFELVERMIGH